MDDTTLTQEEMDICEANVQYVTVKGTVSVDFESIAIELGGDVPEAVGFVKFEKYLLNQVNYRRQITREKMIKAKIARS